MKCVTTRLNNYEDAQLVEGRIFHTKEVTADDLFRVLASVGTFSSEREMKISTRNLLTAICAIIKRLEDDSFDSYLIICAKK